MAFGQQGFTHEAQLGRENTVIVVQKPGEKPNNPGVHVERGPRGGEVPQPRKVNMEPRDTPLPPTSKPGNTWERVGPPKK